MPSHGDQKVAFDVLYISGHGAAPAARSGTTTRVPWSACIPPRGPPSPYRKLSPHPSRRCPATFSLVVTESVRSMSTCVAVRQGAAFTLRSPTRPRPTRDSVHADARCRFDDGHLALGHVERHAADRVARGAPLRPARVGVTAPRRRAFRHGVLDLRRISCPLPGNSGAWLDGVPFEHHVNANRARTRSDSRGSEPTTSSSSRTSSSTWTIFAEPFLAVVHLSNTHFPLPD